MNYLPLFESQNLRMTSLDLEKDPQASSFWTHELEIAARLREDQPARPMAVFEVKKLYEKWQKEADDSNRQFVFAIRKRQTDQQNGSNGDGPDKDAILGVLRIMDIEWVHGAAYLDLIMGHEQDWQSYAREALDLALRYAFNELSLFRVTTVIAEHNQAAQDLFDQANFTLEVRQRQAIYANLRAWDKLHFGLLRPEWKMQQLAGVEA